VIYVLSLKRAEDAEAKVKALEAEIVSLKQRISDARDLIMKKAASS
jgi:predicted  nucleic acid-binding Zn-ribbon protein